MTNEIPFFDFDAEAPNEEQKAELPPTCTFKLGGKTWTVRNRDLVPFGAMFAITAVTEAGAPLAIGPFFKGVVVEEEFAEFEQTLARPDITLSMAVGAAKTVLAALQGRPTKPSVTSVGGRKSTRRKSAGGSSSRATTKRVSAS